ncbi:hypothetical protein ACFFX0_21540 [Citricoccus parietis]|uniref:Uncharacterized protein n=1 Tax=Citricoccus parietis TaxID=592307 RepID=A0ABV5G3Z2_9MICC
MRRWRRRRPRTTGSRSGVTVWAPAAVAAETTEVAEVTEEVSAITP